MLPRIKSALIMLVLIIITQTEFFSQSIYGPVKPNSYREISKVGTQELQSRLNSSDLYCIIGKNMVSGQQAYGRVVFQWDIPDNVIPDNSTITNVQLHFEYTKYNHLFEMGAQFSSLSIDNTNPTQTHLKLRLYLSRQMQQCRQTLKAHSLAITLQHIQKETKENLSE